MGIDRRQLLTAAGSLLGAAPRAISGAESRYEVGAYYFPNYHVDPRNEKVHGKGWSEWELVKRAEPRFPGHQQPKKPLWGFEDESDPKVFARKIDAAADHGLTHFLFDWYWYDGPFLQRGLEEGYLQAGNNHRLKFALMWANHDWLDIQPAKRNMKPLLQYPGVVSEETFERLTDYIVSKYFKHPSYWKIAGRAYFSVYETFPLVQALGGIEKTQAALDRFRKKTQAAGLAGLHLNAVAWGIIQPLPGEPLSQNPKEMLRQLGFDSISSYVWTHHVPLKDFPETDYSEMAAGARQHWQRASGQFGLPYYPNVTMGWDSSPRCCQSDKFENAGYPFCPTLKNNTPAAFRAALESVKGFLDAQGQPKIISINAWNEWTEGSYLEPDTVHQLSYLKAIRQVFGTR